MEKPVLNSFSVLMQLKSWFLPRLISFVVIVIVSFTVVVHSFVSSYFYYQHYHYSNFVVSFLLLLLIVIEFVLLSLSYCSHFVVVAVLDWLIVVMFVQVLGLTCFLARKHQSLVKVIAFLHYFVQMFICALLHDNDCHQ